MPARADWEALGRSLHGQLLLPSSQEYERARRPFLVRFDAIKPQAVVRCAAPGDVVDALAFADRFGLETAARSGGHDFARRSSTRGVLLDLTLLDQVEMSDGTVKVGAGIRIDALCERLFEQGLAIPTGTCPSVGIGGLTVCGGLGILGRKFGLTGDRLLTAEVVLADGQVITCDSAKRSDLFWALRGAGAASFGIVTAFTFRPVNVPETTTSFRLAWPYAQAAAVIDAWQRWAPVGADELDAELSVSASTDPGREPTVEVVGAVLAGYTHAEPFLAELIDGVGSEPISVERRELSYLDTCRFQADVSVAGHMVEWTADGRRRPGYRHTASEFFDDPLPPDGIAALVELLGARRREGQSRGLWFGPWGGAYNRPAIDATAFPHRDQLFILEHAAAVAPTATAAEKRAADEWTRRSSELAHRWGSGRVYPAFPDPELADWERAYYGEQSGRLREIKARYDPGNRFRGTQTIPVP